MPNEVLVEYTSGPKKGKQYVVPSAAQARKVHPDAKIVAHHPSGEPYRESKSNGKSSTKDENKDGGK